MKLPIRIGLPNNGGALATAGGLIFIAAATDNLLRAIGIKTGRVVWRTKPKCLKGHLQDLSRPCRAQLAQMAAPSK